MLLSFTTSYHLIGFVLGSCTEKSFNFIVKVEKRVFRCVRRQFSARWGHKQVRLGAIHFVNNFSIKIA